MWLERKESSRMKWRINGLEIASALQIGSTSGSMKDSPPILRVCGSNTQTGAQLWMNGSNRSMEVWWQTVITSSRRARQQLRSEEHTSELQSQSNLVCRLLLEKK